MLDELGASQPLVVTGKTVGASPLLTTLEHAVAPHALEVFNGSEPHAPQEAIEAGLACLRQTRADCLISLGGSSPVDVARGMMLRHGTEASFAQLRAAPPSSAIDTLPLIAVTTTLSQAEFSDIVGITDPASEEKHLFQNDGILPLYVVLDAELAALTPLRLWLSTGVKALDTTLHLYFAFADPQPFWKPLLLDAAELLWRLLPACHQDPDSLGIRQRLQVAAWKGEFPAFHLPVDQSIAKADPWLGAAARHQLGARTRLPHGELGAALLPMSLRFHLGETYERQQTLAERLGFDSPERLREALERFLRGLDLPASIGEVSFSVDWQEITHAILDEEPAFASRADSILEALRN